MQNRSLTVSLPPKIDHWLIMILVSLLPQFRDGWVAKVGLRSRLGVVWFETCSGHVCWLGVRSAWRWPVSVFVFLMFFLLLLIWFLSLFLLLSVSFVFYVFFVFFFIDLVSLFFFFFSQWVLLVLRRTKIPCRLCAWALLVFVMSCRTRWDLDLLHNALEAPDSFPIITLTRVKYSMGSKPF